MKNTLGFRLPLILSLFGIFSYHKRKVMARRMMLRFIAKPYDIFNAMNTSKEWSSPRYFPFFALPFIQNSRILNEWGQWPHILHIVISYKMGHKVFCHLWYFFPCCTKGIGGVLCTYIYYMNEMKSWNSFNKTELSRLGEVLAPDKQV